ncbi:Mth938-like domain-containing protein [Rhodomicrobium sp. Az07]|uniref:Mth938-like domain-containing protein n=1 Tax=Rhodomicrobium sp. Az07 TaxID=2839034 RepID=UPI001BECE58A|nr:Mth938-like domain-containing protein [Rhodomicrobium sp. Az07]MBT3069898.1 Mth938-like domain-containing protein [Rhodomicrobium sp. Az07]
MSGSLTRLGPRAPVSLTPGGALQFAGTIRDAALLISTAEVFAWGATEDAREADILRFLDTRETPGDFLLYGTGASLRFASPAFARQIEKRGLGLETMDTAAACRTYNVLIAERRRFTAALLPIPRV